MKSEYISLSSIDDVKKFTDAVCRVDYDVDLSSGRYTVDAKSIMGIFSLDLSKPIKIDMHCKNDSDADEFLAKIEKYIMPKG